MKYAPASVKEKVKSMNLTPPHCYDFTAYTDSGSPKHPSYPAMHSAASSASLWLPVVMKLTDEQVAEARRVDWAVSRFRTVAGVHYDSDNRAGLTIGQAMVAAALPEFLTEFGANKSVVEEK